MQRRKKRLVPLSRHCLVPNTKHRHHHHHRQSILPFDGLILKSGHDLCQFKKLPFCKTYLYLVCVSSDSCSSHQHAPTKNKKIGDKCAILAFPHAFMDFMRFYVFLGGFTVFFVSGGISPNTFAFQNLPTSLRSLFPNDI